MRPHEASLSSRVRSLLGSYLDSGGLQREDELELSRLRNSAEAKGLPTTAGSRLQSLLFLVRVALDVLALLADGNRRQAKQELVTALDEAEAAAEAPALPVDPFDGMLFVLAARLAREEGDAPASDRMRIRTEVVKNQMLSEDEAMAGLLESYLSRD